MAKLRVYVCDICHDKIEQKDNHILSCFDPEGNIYKHNAVKLHMDVCKNCFEKTVEPWIRKFLETDGIE